MVRSRLYSIKEKRELRQASFLIVVAIVLLIGFVFWGLPTLALLVGNNLIRQTGQTQQEIEIRPASPVLTDVPESTREDKITISGYAQPGLEVTLYINAQERAKMLVDEAGEFSFVGVPLDPDVNEIYAFAYNPTNKLESEKSRVYTLIKDKKPPELVVESPANGSVFRTERERVITIVGSVNEEGTKVFVDDRLVIVSPDLTFTTSRQLAEGEQEIIVKAIDRAGNEDSVPLKLRWEQ